MFAVDVETAQLQSCYKTFMLTIDRTHLYEHLLLGMTISRAGDMVWISQTGRNLLK